MKKILFALAICSFAINADAQKNKGNFNQNFNVCYVGGRYQICEPGQAMSSGYGAPTSATTATGGNDAYVNMASETSMNRHSRKKSNMRVMIDDPNGAYEGKETLTNDGVFNTIQRNTNYLDAGVTLPSSDGGVSNRR